MNEKARQLPTALSNCTSNLCPPGSMPFHERQEGSLCAQHALNSLLQGPYFSPMDLAELARALDEAERSQMAGRCSISARLPVLDPRRVAVAGQRWCSVLSSTGKRWRRLVMLRCWQHPRLLLVACRASSRELLTALAFTVEGGVEGQDYLKYMAEGSSNYDDSGFFSSQVPPPHTHHTPPPSVYPYTTASSPFISSSCPAGSVCLRSSRLGSPLPV